MAFTGERKREYQLAWIKARREQWIKEHGPCVDCGSWDDLEVDHANRAEKIKNVSQVWGCTAAKREEELRKCVVRCYGCHKKKTIAEKTLPESERHGRPSTYKNHKCRCALCVEAANRAKRAYRARGGAH